MLFRAGLEFKKTGKSISDSIREQVSEKWGRGIFSNIFEPDKSYSDKVKQEIKDMAGSIKDFLYSFDIPTNLIDEFIKKMVEAGKAGQDALRNAGEQAAKEAERMRGILAKMTGDTDTVIEKMSDKWTDAIFDMAKGTKTFSDVWQMVLDDALRNFIGGFIRGMLEAHSKMLGKMVAQWWTAQTAMGFAGGKTDWLGIAGKVLGLFSGGGGGASFAGESFALSTSPLHPANVPMFASGGVVRKPTLGMIGESGPEAVVPLDEYNSGGGSLTIINVVDPNFVNSQIAQDPNTVINVINADLIRGGSTRKTMRRVK